MKIFWMLGIIVIIVSITSSLVISCRREHKEELYTGLEGKVLHMMSSPTRTGGSTMNTKVIIIYSDSLDKCAEIVEGDGNEFLNSEWFYNHKAGDDVEFKYIRKDRFFPVKDTARLRIVAE